MPTATSLRFFGPLAALARLVGCAAGPPARTAESAARVDASAATAQVVTVAAFTANPGLGRILPVYEAPPDPEEAAVEEPVVEEPVVEEEGAPFADRELYVDRLDNNAGLQALLWEVVDPAGADLMEIMSDAAVGLWMGDWSGDIEDAVDEALDVAGDDLLTLVAYNIPNRDCGNWSAGGVADVAEYEEWLDGFAAGIQGREVIVVVEPDALALTDCLDDDQKIERLAMLSYAVDVLAGAGASVYLDAGDSNWIPSEDMAEQLLGANVANAAGFALNVSHTEFTSNEIAYAEEIRAIIGEDAHYVVDTGRNGNGPTWDNEWCNPQGVAVGEFPSTQSDVDGLDAYLWVKPPGESDGYCAGGPAAGDWWPEYAADMMDAAGY